MTSNVKPTPGPWMAINATSYLDEGPSWMIAGVAHCGDGELSEANARLIAEAGTVYHETGFSPRQLAEQRAELLAACEERLHAQTLIEEKAADNRIAAAINRAKGGA